MDAMGSVDGASASGGAPDGARKLALSFSFGDADLDEAARLHLESVEVGTDGYYSRRDHELDDGTYRLVDDRLQTDEDKLEVKAATLRQMPPAAEALVRAVRATTRRPDNPDAHQTLEICLDGVLDAAGTFLALVQADAEARRDGDPLGRGPSTS